MITFRAISRFGGTRINIGFLKCTCSIHEKPAAKNKLDNSPLFVIKEDALLGKQWVAAQSIKAGTILIEESPALVAPKWKGTFSSLKTESCVSCTKFRTKSEKDKKCTKCGWPVCGPECEKMEIHEKNECKIFTENIIQYPAPDFEMSEICSFIGLIRGENLKSLNPSLYKEIMSLQDYKDLPHCNQQILVNSEFRYEALSRFFPQSRDSVENYQKLHRIINVNAYSTEGIESGSFIMLYPKVSRLNHSCSPNCYTSISSPPDLKMRVITSIDVPRGMSLTVSYNHMVQNLGTRERQLAFRNFDGPGFICKCDRCLDPTENNSYISGITCTTCRDDFLSKGVKDPTQFGYFLPVNPLDVEDDDNSKWKCDVCGDVKTTNEIIPLVQTVENLLGNEDQDIELYENIVENYSGDILHPNHWVIQTCVRKMLNILESRKTPLEDLLQHTMYLLNITDKTWPGLNMERGELLLKAATLLTVLLKQKQQKGEVDEYFKKGLDLCKTLQDESSRCFENKWPVKVDSSMLSEIECLEKLVKIRQSILDKL